MMSAPAFHGRVVYLAPEGAVGGVGAYADVFVEHLRRYVDDVVEIRHGKPGTDSVAALRSRRRQLRRLIDEAAPGPVVVHVELSGGSLESFWPTAFLQHRPQVLASATVHDPPGLVWWPARTRFVARRRLLNHGVHFPARPAVRVLERIVASDRTLFTLSAAGARSLRERYPRADVHQMPFFVHSVPDITPVTDRPLAVGMFGLIYRGKGFEHIRRIRERLDPAIALRIAGRGTESLPAVDGVEVLGGLDGADLDDFFASIRALLIPYGRRSPYGEAYPASSVVAHATAYRTPMVSTARGTLAELGDDGAAVIVDDTAVADDIACAAEQLVSDPAALVTIATVLDRHREAHSPERVVRSYVEAWASSA